MATNNISPVPISLSFSLEKAKHFINYALKTLAYFHRYRSIQDFCLNIIFNLFDLFIYYFVLSIIIVTYIYFEMRSLSIGLWRNEKKRVFIARQREGKRRGRGGDERAFRPQSYKLYIWFRSHFSVFYFFIFPFRCYFCSPSLLLFGKFFQDEQKTRIMNDAVKLLCIT